MKGLTTNRRESFFLCAGKTAAQLQKFAWNFAIRQQVHRAAGWVDDCVVQAETQGVVDDRAEIFDTDFA